MTLLQEILTWSQELPAWQSDAVARLLSKETLTTEDREDLLALLKAKHGIPDPKNRKPKPLAADQIPSPESAETEVRLLAMKNLRHVNAIAENHRLQFNAEGMTVIYGDNGSGKSGYSRVLKLACRARDQTEEIHPNANIPKHTAGNAEAIFEIKVDGADQEVRWVNREAAPDPLSAIAILDSHCARAYLEKEDDFCFVPYGLDVFPRLAQVCDRLRVKIQSELDNLNIDVAAFDSLRGDTPVGTLIKGLSAKTKPEQIETLATLSSEELAQHESLDKSLKVDNPQEKAAQTRLRAQRIATLAKTAIQKAALVDDKVVAKLRELAESHHVAQAAAALAANRFKNAENLLPGTGGKAWRALFEAARNFAVESHPDESFPELDPSSPCPLCQQPLAESAQRLQNFQAYIEEEATQAAQQRSSTFREEAKRFAEVDLGLNFDDATYAEIEMVAADLARTTRAFEAGLASRRQTIKTALDSHHWEKPAQTLVNPAPQLQELADQLNAEAETLEKASDQEMRAALQRQLSDLDARVRLGQVKDSVIRTIDRLRYQAKLERCLADLKTTAISRKASDLTSKVVSKELADALNNELRQLGAGSLRVSLESRSVRGKALHKLKLKLPRAPSPKAILSEGEQRAIAIGSFLTEVVLSGSSGGIVFDDPVSSLDHRRRSQVARRLATEATRRQVIVFTHDIYFLCLLVEEAKRSRAPILTQTLMRRAEGFGVADPDLPFEGKTTKKRIGALKDRHQEIAKLHRNGEEQELRKQTVDAYFHLRMTWERAVEEVLLREVILRFRKGIETQRLAGVVVEDDDYAMVYAGMSKCSNYAHDVALRGGAAVPEPDELLADIEALDSWRKKIIERSEETEKNRKP